jgi:signal transduction histidine kinase
MNRPFIRVLQHLAFWILSYFVFLNLYKADLHAGKIDYIYTVLFHITILPAVYINLEILLPRQGNGFPRWWYLPLITILIIFSAWINYSFFERWSNLVFPDYFFISYFSFNEVVVFFIVYLTVTTLIKLSKSWFIVNRLQTELLIAEKKKVELELTALRAQMNPHFIFNCMNSIKSLIQQNKEQKAIDYLTTFSKLLRTILQNSDQKEISLHDEIQTCKLYIELESMRFGNKLKFNLAIDPDIDIKSLKVPALIIQPFIENAIWHGIMPKDDGGTVTIRVSRNANQVICSIEDDGIGRTMSEQNKFKSSSPSFPSMGLQLTKSRLDLDNILFERHVFLEIKDRLNKEEKTTGTSVILTFKDF